MILIGTSGYAYSDWVGPFYPAGTQEEAFLPLYAQEFLTTELDFADNLPSALMSSSLASQVPAAFKFTVHLHAIVTHQRDLAGVDEYVQAVRPLLEAEQFGCALARFPRGFDNRLENKIFLQRLRESLDEIPLLVEFPHKDWIVDGMEGWLRENGIGFCCVDQPRLKDLVQPIAWATGPVACVRFHGRNYQGWDSPDAEVRHDHSYDMLDLAEWLPKIEELADKTDLTLIYMNNFPQAQAVEAARAMRRMLQVD